MNEIIINNESKTNIKDMIYTIRGQQVMLDSDLAMLYGYEVKRLNEQVKNNIERFPEDFMFQLRKEELPICLKSKFSTLNETGNKRGLHIKKMPFVFTEQGIYMLSTVLKGEIAVKQSIMIMRVFKEMRHYIIENRPLLTSSEYEQLSKRIDKHDEKFDFIENQMNVVMDNFVDNNKLKEYVFLDGQKFEADEAYISIYKRAKSTIHILDDYISIKTLSHLKYKNSGVNVVIFSDNKGTSDKLRIAEFIDFNKQYPTLEILTTNNTTHDRLIVIDFGTDNEEIYLCGASSKDAGSKLCFITKLQNNEVYKPIIYELLGNPKLALI